MNELSTNNRLIEIDDQNDEYVCHYLLCIFWKYTFLYWSLCLDNIVQHSLYVKFYCYQIFALFLFLQIQSPIMLWLRYCLKCPHNCWAWNSNCPEFCFISNKDSDTKVTTCVKSGLEKDLTKTHLTENGNVKNAWGTYYPLDQLLLFKYRKETYFVLKFRLFSQPRQLSHLT